MYCTVQSKKTPNEAPAKTNTHHTSSIRSNDEQGSAPEPKTSPTVPWERHSDQWDQWPLPLPSTNSPKVRIGSFGYCTKTHGSWWDKQIKSNESNHINHIESYHRIISNHIIIISLYHIIIWYDISYHESYIIINISSISYHNDCRVGLALVWPEPTGWSFCLKDPVSVSQTSAGQR